MSKEKPKPSDTGGGTSARRAHSPTESDDKTRDPTFPFNLTEYELDRFMAHPKFEEFLEHYEMTADEFIAYIASGKKSLRENPEAFTEKKSDAGPTTSATLKLRGLTPQPMTAEEAAEANIREADRQEERVRQSELQHMEDLALAALNDAVMARRIADDAKIAYASGKSLPPLSTVTIARPKPGGGMTTPAVIATGTTRMVVSTESAPGGMRGERSLYAHFERKVKYMSRLFADQQRIRFIRDPTDEAASRAQEGMSSIAAPKEKKEEARDDTRRRKTILNLKEADDDELREHMHACADGYDLAAAELRARRAKYRKAESVTIEDRQTTTSTSTKGARPKTVPIEETSSKAESRPEADSDVRRARAMEAALSRQRAQEQRLTPKSKAKLSKGNSKETDLDEMKRRLAKVMDKTPEQQLQDRRRAMREEYMRLRQQEKAREAESKSGASSMASALSGASETTRKTETRTDEATAKARKKLSFDEYFAERRDREKAEYEEAVAQLRADFAKRLKELTLSKRGYDPTSDRVTDKSGQSLANPPTTATSTTSTKAPSTSDTTTTKSVEGALPQSRLTQRRATAPRASPPKTRSRTKSASGESGEILLSKPSPSKDKPKSSSEKKRLKEKPRPTITASQLKAGLAQVESTWTAKAKRESDLAFKMRKELEVKQEARDRRNAERVSSVMNEFKTPTKRPKSILKSESSYASNLPARTLWEETCKVAKSAGEAAKTVAETSKGVAGALKKNTEAVQRYEKRLTNIEAKVSELNQSMLAARQQEDDPIPVPFGSGEEIERFFSVEGNADRLGEWVMERFRYHRSFPREFIAMILTDEYKTTVYWPTYFQGKTSVHTEYLPEVFELFTYMIMKQLAARDAPKMELTSESISRSMQRLFHADRDSNPRTPKKTPGSKRRLRKTSRSSDTAYTETGTDDEEEEESEGTSTATPSKKSRRDRDDDYEPPSGGAGPSGASRQTPARAPRGSTRSGTSTRSRTTSKTQTKTGEGRGKTQRKSQMDEAHHSDTCSSDSETNNGEDSDTDFSWGDAWFPSTPDQLQFVVGMAETAAAAGDTSALGYYQGHFEDLVDDIVPEDSVSQQASTLSDEGNLDVHDLAIAAHDDDNEDKERDAEEKQKPPSDKEDRSDECHDDRDVGNATTRDLTSSEPDTDILPGNLPNHVGPDNHGVDGNNGSSRPDATSLPPSLQSSVGKAPAMLVDDVKDGFKKGLPGGGDTPAKMSGH